MNPDFLNQLQRHSYGFDSDESTAGTDDPQGLGPGLYDPAEEMEED